MHPQSPKSLEQIADACTLIFNSTQGRTLADFEHEPLLWAGIRYKLQSIGEALNRMRKNDPHTVRRISNYEKIIGFRNRVAHEYDELDDIQVWGIIQQSLPVLQSEVELLLRETGD
jgi:uncharacterized protein with HEPN domain